MGITGLVMILLMNHQRRREECQEIKIKTVKKITIANVMVDQSKQIRQKITI